MSVSWGSVTRVKPCPACGKPDWCRISPDGQVVACRRLPSDDVLQWSDGPAYIHPPRGKREWGAGPSNLATPREGRSAIDPTEANAVYGALLDVLSLSDPHRAELRARGLSDGEIDRRQYRTLPLSRAAVVQCLRERLSNNTLLAVPGFYQESGQVRLAGAPGILIPVRDLKGQVVALKIRRDAPEGNRYRWLSSRSKSGPSPGAPVHAPLFNWARATVRITEGELKADVATVLSKVLTVSIPGVSSWRKALPVLEAIKPEMVLLAFDADFRINENVSRALADLYRDLVKTGFDVRLETWDPTNKGIDDALAVGATVTELSREESRRLIEDLPRDLPDVGQGEAEIDWPEPVPLPGDLPPVMPFNFRLLPDAFRPWIEDIANRVQCSPDFPAVGAMVVLSSAVGRRIGIRPKLMDDWLVVPNLWGAIVGPPGTMKTPALMEPLGPLNQAEARAWKEHEAELAEFEKSSLIAEEQRKVCKDRLRKALKSGDSGDELADEILTHQPEPPARRRFIVNDSTVEKLGELLNQNQHGLLLYRDELVGFMRSLDKKGHECDRAFYLEAWNGGGLPFTYDRIGRGSIRIEAPCIAILGTIQPGPLSQYVSEAVGGALDDGLIQRFQMLVWPDRQSGEWCNVDHWPDPHARREAREVFERVLSMEPDSAGLERDERGIPFVRFDQEAQELFVEWRAELETRLRKAEEPTVLLSHLEKFRSLVPSVALLGHLADSGAGPVGMSPLVRAIGWAHYLESHARRVYAPAIGTDFQAARALAEKIREGELSSPFRSRDVYRNCWSGLTRESTTMALGVLSDLEWIRPERTSGGRPTVEYRINPRLEGRA